MGCGTSSAGATTAGDKDDFEDGQKNRKRPAGDEEDDFFEAVKAEGESFMASKPWKGQVIEPSDHLPLNPEKPDVNFELEYVYGYRTYASRQNAYFNNQGQATYFSAAVGVVLDIQSNTQKFFGGGEVDTENRNQKNDQENHNDDIESMAISNDRCTAVTGQRGPHAAIFTWDAVTGEKKCRIKVAKSKAIRAVALSNDAKYVGCVDDSTDHKVHVFDAHTGAACFSQNGDQNPIYGISFTNQPGEYTMCTTGKRHVAFWEFQQSKKQKGLSGKNPIGTHMTSAWDADGCAYTGFQDGKIFVWSGREAQKVIQGHSGCVEAIRWDNGVLMTGARDNKVCTWSTPDMTQLKCFSFDSSVKSVDCFNGMLLVGEKSGTISCCSVSGDGSDKQEIMHSHNEGEVWGLCQADGGDCVMTTGDDNRCIVWDTQKRGRKGECTITDDVRRAARGGASSQSHKPSSQQARAVCCFNGHAVVACNDGSVRVRDMASKSEVKVLRDSKEWIQVLAPNCDGTRLAVGSHDNAIYVYDGSFNLMYKTSGHSSYITAVDWDESGTIMRSNSGDYELLFWDAQGKQDASGRSNYKDTKWATQTAKMAWTVEGIYPAGADGTYVNSVCASNDEAFICTGDDSRLWRIFNNPVRFNHKPRCYRGHSEFVQNVVWDKNDKYVWTVGGQDMTLMQWKKC